MAGQALSETNGHKLTVEDIQEIRRQYAYGRQRKLIAKQFGISVHSVWKIAHGLSHKTERQPRMGITLTDEYRKCQSSAIAIVNAAVKDGSLPNLLKVNVLCVDCKVARAIEYEHRDYTKPLEVEPVCHRCNIRRGSAALIG